MAKVPYKRSVRKQIETAAIFAILVLMLGAVLYPIDRFDKMITFGILAVGFGIIAIANVRRLAKTALCPGCRADLYEMIEAARFKKARIRYCPVCGTPIEL